MSEGPKPMCPYCIEPTEFDHQRVYRDLHVVYCSECGYTVGVGNPEGYVPE